MKIQIIYLLIITMIFSCRPNGNNIQYINNDTFIKSKGNYYFQDYEIVIKKFENETLVYGIFGGPKNQCLYQQNINQSFNNNSKWTIYTDKNNRIWFYTKDLGELSVFYKKNDSLIYIDKKNNLPKIPEKLQNFINN